MGPYQNNKHIKLSLIHSLHIDTRSNHNKPLVYAILSNNKSTINKEGELEVPSKYEDTG